MANESVAIDWYQPASGMGMLFSANARADPAAARAAAEELRTSVGQVLVAAVDRGDGLDVDTTFLCRFVMEAAEALAIAAAE